jgi:type I restriction enzyme S subunit
MANWKEYKLSDLMDVIGGGTPKTSVVEYWGGDIPWLSVVDFGNGNKKVFDTEKKITPKGLNNSSTRILKKGQLIISARGTVGELAVLGRDMAFNQSCYGLNAKSEICTNDFLYYLMKCKISELKRNAHGAVFDTITRKTFETVSASIPALPTQTAIAEILSSLDDKIELNNKINQELENLAQALFKRWFIDFEFPFDFAQGKPNANGEPYKSSGGEMVESELGDIPKGWEVKEIGLVAKLGAGGDKPKNVSEIPTEELNIPIYSNGITNDGLYGYTDKAKIFEESVTISARGTIGFLCLRTTPFVPIVRLISASADEQYISTKYLYMWLKNQNIYGNGTTQQQLTVPDFKTSKILLAERTLVDEYTVQMNGIIENINFNKSENQELTNLRDTLLPRLISGALEVSEVMAEGV